MSERAKKNKKERKGKKGKRNKKKSKVKKIEKEWEIERIQSRSQCKLRQRMRTRYCRLNISN